MQQLWSASFWCTCSFFGYVKILKCASDLKFRGVCGWWWRRKWACCLCNLNFRRGNLFLCPSLGDWGRGGKKNNFIVGFLFVAHSSLLDFLHLPNRSTFYPEASVLWVRTLNAMDNFSGPRSPYAREIRRRGNVEFLLFPSAPCL